MAISVVMPALEMAQETGKLLSWLKKEGETIKKGDLLLEIETDKAVVEVEATGEGVLAGITAHEGDVVPVGQVIAWILLPGEPTPALTVAAPAARASNSLNEAAQAPKNGEQPPERRETPSTAARVSPKAKRLATELNVNLHQVTGTGPEGTVTAEDVQQFAQLSNAGSGAGSGTRSGARKPEPLSQIARLMALRVTESWTTVPHFFVVREVDAGGLIETQKKFNSDVEKSRGVRLTLTDILISLVSRVLAKHPKLNASWTGDTVQLNPAVHISVAMAVKDGVVGAVIRNADTLDIAEIAVQRRDLTERARAGRLRPADIDGGTFTISNLGMYKVDAFSAIIAPPQAAILAVGAVGDRVVPVEGRPGIRPMVTLTLSSDHRVTDGAGAAEFMNDLAQATLNPA